MKLISLNMEGMKHIDLVEPFISHEEADVVCLQEAPEGYQQPLREHGYTTAFAPVLIRDDQGAAFREGVIIASRHPTSFSHEYYRKSEDTVVAPKERISDDTAHPLLFAQITFNNTVYVVATTHVMVTAHGVSDTAQREGIEKMLSILKAKPPHVLCGDFNMPRGVNDQYEIVTRDYTDAIPKEYKSSLDESIHRLGPIKDTLDEPIFEEYLVDYIFTQSPYRAEQVHLKFGVSDHAAVVGVITKT